MAISPQRLTIYLYSTHRAVIFAIAQLTCCMIHSCDRQTDGRRAIACMLSRIKSHHFSIMVTLILLHHMSVPNLTVIMVKKWQRCLCSCNRKTL